MRQHKYNVGERVRFLSTHDSNPRYDDFGERWITGKILSFHFVLSNNPFAPIYKIEISPGNCIEMPEGKVSKSL